MSEQDNQAGSDPILQWVTYHLEQEVYGINVMQVQEVLRPTEIAPVPGAPDYVLGNVKTGSRRVPGGTDRLAGNRGLTRACLHALSGSPDRYAAR